MTTVTEVRERPILFKAPMVRAILREEGPKTETRRVVKPQPEPWRHFNPDYNPTGEIAHAFGRWWTGERCIDGSVPAVRVDGDYPGEEYGERWFRCPYGVPGDLLYVRETWAAVVPGGNFDEITGPPSGFPPEWRKRYVCRYKADPDPLSDSDPEIRGFRWRPSIHMPKWAARIWLRVTEVRVERVQEITLPDVEREGVDPLESWGAPKGGGLLRDDFRRLWDSINADRGYGWDVNPWVWVVSFERTEAPHG